MTQQPYPKPRSKYSNTTTATTSNKNNMNKMDLENLLISDGITTGKKSDWDEANDEISLSESPPLATNQSNNNNKNLNIINNDSASPAWSLPDVAQLIITNSSTHLQKNKILNKNSGGGGGYAVKTTMTTNKKTNNNNNNKKLTSSSAKTNTTVTNTKSIMSTPAKTTTKSTCSSGRTVVNGRTSSGGSATGSSSGEDDEDDDDNEVEDDDDEDEDDDDLINLDPIGSLSSGGDSVDSGMPSKPDCFLLIDEQELLQVKTCEEFIAKLGCDSNTLVKVVSIFGNTGEGKSHTLNFTFFECQEVFRTSPTQNSCTIGIWCAYDRKRKVITIDTEGLLGLSENNNRRTRLLLKVMAISDVIIYRTRAERLHTDLFNFLGSASQAYIKHFAKELRASSERCNLQCTVSQLVSV